MNKRHYEHTLPNIRGSLSNTYFLSLLSEGFPRPAGFDLRAGHKADRREIRQGGSG